MYASPSTTQKNTGRINLEGPDISKLFSIYDKIPANQCATLREPTIGQWEDTDLSRTFISEQNIRIIQNGIRWGVYQTSNHQYTIENQDCDSLKIIMRSIFLQHSANQPTNVKGQVGELNKMVLDYCIPHVYSEAQSYMKYLRDVSTVAIPPAPPVMATQFDNRETKLKPWF